MQLLHAVHAQVVAAFCAFAHGFAAGDGGVLRHALGEGGAADAVAVGDGLRRAADGVDHQRDFAVFNRVHDVRAAFLHFVHRLYDDAVLFQVFGGAACGADAVAECLEVLRGFDDERFVFVAHGEEDFAGRVQAFACAELGFVVGFAEACAHAHHFAGGAHFGAEDGVYAGEFDEGEHGFFNGIEIGNDFFFHALLLQGNARHAACADFGERHAGGFGDEGNGAAGARVHFQYEHHAVLHGKLYVHQADHTQRVGHGFGLAADFVLDFFAERVGRQRAAGVAGVDARLFDVLHDAADNDVFAV